MKRARDWGFGMSRQKAAKILGFVLAGIGGFLIGSGAVCVTLPKLIREVLQGYAIEHGSTFVWSVPMEEGVRWLGMFSFASGIIVIAGSLFALICSCGSESTH